MTETFPSILIVDDDGTNRRVFRAVLKDIGAELHVAASGEEALAACAKREFAMVLLDVHLADMSGFDVARRLREAVPAVTAPILFVSAVYTDEADAFRAYDLGAVDYLMSPVVPSILRAKAMVFLRMFRMHQEAIDQRVAIEAAFRELRSAHVELEQFTHSASHDLRTPIANISGMAQLLGRPPMPRCSTRRANASSATS